MGMRCVHFVGFRGDEYVSAVRVWGKPHFIHLINDVRVWNEVGDGDIVILGPKATDEISAWTASDQDHVPYGG